MNVEIKNYPSARTLVAEICGDIDTIQQDISGER